MMPDRVLIRGVNWLGDAVMSMPALQRLREHWPAAQIVLLTHEKLAALWHHHSAINRCLTFAEGDNPFAVARRLRRERFDLALVLPNSHRAALETLLARIPRRIGYRRPGRNWMLTEVVPARHEEVAMHKRSLAEIQRLIASPGEPSAHCLTSTSHHLHQYLHLASFLGADPNPLRPRIEIRPDEVELLRHRLDLPQADNPSPVFIGINANAEYGSAKRWPHDRFISLAVTLATNPSVRFVIFGGPKEADAGEALVAAIRTAARLPNQAVVSLAGRTNLRELCAALKLCRVLVTNDSGPMHVAAAVGTSVVALFGSTSPELTGPGLPGDPQCRVLRSHAPCAPCFLRECPIDLRCQKGIAVESVAAAVLEFLRNSRQA